MNKNRVSVSALEELCKKTNAIKATTLPIGDGNDTFEFVVKHRLNAAEVTSIVDAVCGGVVNTEIGAYRPELKDYFLRVAVIRTYTNIDLPNDERCWDLVYGTPIFAMVTGHENRPVIFDCWDYDDRVIDAEQYEQILKAIDQKIAYAILHSYAPQVRRIDSKISKSMVGRVFNLEDSGEAGGR